MAVEREVKLIFDVVPAGSGNAKKALEPLANEAKKAKGDAGKILDALPAGGKGGGGGMSNILGGLMKSASGGVKGMFDGIMGGLSSMGGGIAKVAAVAGPVGLALAAVAMVGSKVVGVFADLVQTGLRWAAVANPALFDRYQTAVQDTQAVLGRVFVPVLELVARGARTVGDVFASILPTSGEVRRALSPLNDLFTDMRNIAGDLAPIFRGVILQSLTMFAIALKALILPLQAAAKLMHMIFGVTGGKLQSSVGASGGHASFIGLSELGQQSQLSAFGAGTMGEKLDPQQQAVGKLASLLEAVVQIKDVVVKYGGGAAKAAAKAADVAGGFGKGVADASGLGVFRALGNWVGSTWRR